MIEPAPAKINLTLEVLGRRSDGFHEIRSLVMFARDAADAVRLRASEPDTFSVSGPFAAAIGDHNLVVAARRALADAGIEIGGALYLEKNLPVAGGIGGGSADAAAVLRIGRALYPDARIDWPAVAASLGADVPVCFGNEPALMSGLGERVMPLAAPRDVHAVLVNAPGNIPARKTAAVFKALGAPPIIAGDAAAVIPDVAFLDTLIAYASTRGNDLQRPATVLMPWIADVLAALNRSTGCRLAAMSGAGPTCFGLYADLAEAQAAASTLKTMHPDWWIVPTRLA